MFRPSLLGVEEGVEDSAIAELAGLIQARLAELQDKIWKKQGMKEAFSSLSRNRFLHFMK